MYLKKGDFIIKKSFTVFNSNKLPVEEIKSFNKKREVYFINGIRYDDLSIFEIIDESRKDEIMKVWDNLIIFPKPSYKKNSCIRNDNGQDKTKFSLKTVKYILFRYKMLYPDKNFQAYKCDKCKHYHLGKGFDNLFQRWMVQLKKFLCRHDWKNISGMGAPDYKQGEMVMASRLHECKKCDKREMKGMGMYI